MEQEDQRRGQDKDRQERRGMARDADAGAVSRPAGTRYRTCGNVTAQQGKTAGNVSLCRVRETAVPLGDEIRIGYWLAEFLRTGGRRCGQRARGPLVVHAPHRGALRRLRRASWPRLQRWPRADRPALLHERRGARFRTRRGLSLGLSRPASARCGRHPRPWPPCRPALRAGVPRSPARQASRGSCRTACPSRPESRHRCRRR